MRRSDNILSNYRYNIIAFNTVYNIFIILSQFEFNIFFTCIEYEYISIYIFFF